MRLASALPALAAAALLAGCSASGGQAAAPGATSPAVTATPVSAVCAALDADYRAYAARPGQHAAHAFAGQLDRLARSLGYTDALLENYLRDAGKAMAATPASRAAMAEVQRAKFACLR